jgi:membrane protein
MGFLKRIFQEWNKHDAPRLGASLAFYTILSLSPLLLLTIAVAAFFFDRSLVTGKITDEIQGVIGGAAAQAIQSIIQSAQSSQSGKAVSVISLVILLLGASGVFAELRTALNRIWEVNPENGAGIWGMIREKLLSFGLVLSVGFLLVAALVLSAVLAFITTFLGGLVPIPHFLAVAIDVLVSLAGVGTVFALIFRYVPAVKVPWRNAWKGGMITSVLFTAGKYLIGFYLAKAAPGSAYGTAGSVIVVIVWVYYTAQIVFLGAEFTHLDYTRETSRPRPS